MSFMSRTVGDVVSEILMSRTAFSGSFLIVEGDGDSRFYRRRCAKDSCQIVIAGGKDTACSAVARVSSGGERGVLGIVDDDFDSILGVQISSPHLLRTETRDLEALLLKSLALDHVIDEFGDEARVKALEAAENSTIREALVSRSLIFGKLRFAARRENWSVDFTNVSPWRFADVASWAIDEHALLSFVAHAANVSVGAVRDVLNAIPAVDPYLLLHGRDTLNVLAIGFRQKIGSQQQPAERICRMLRLAFSDSLANATQLFQSIRAWEQANQPFRILFH